MKVLVVTGGIGSGKSYILKIFKALGYPIYLSDNRAKELYYENSELLIRLEKLLGPSIIKDGMLDRKAMAAIIFNDPVKLKGVEELLFPMLGDDFEKWKRSQTLKSGINFVIFESAIYLERPKHYFPADKVLTISVELEKRRQRVVERDNISLDDLNSRLKNQWTDEQREAEADFVIQSDEDSALLPQVLYVIEQINKLD